MKKILFAVLVLILGCKEKKSIPMNLELKKRVYEVISKKIDSKDSVFRFNEIVSDSRIDSGLLFNSYTSIHEVKSYLGEYEIAKYSNQVWVGENEELFLFKSGNNFIYYFILDSLFIVPDLSKNVFPSNCLFNLKTINMSNYKKGAYLIPSCLESATSDYK